ncbi:DUF6463 family protein [Dechloromonas sp. ZY10]|uniref:DUF6463 family protein n=1 Tax=Dechloromonas aquae TaxID=2664436 RepID=UPI0035293C63
MFPLESSPPLAVPARRWRGRALCLIALVHTGFAFGEFPEVWQALFADGLLDSVGRDPLRGVVAWFFLFGVLLWLLGMAVDLLERQVPGWRSPALGGALLLLLGLGVGLMPASGFWLVLPVALSLFR